jgi:hypothetical protein
MQSIIESQAKRSTQIEEYYNECLDKAVNRIKRTYDEERGTSMILKVGEVAGLKGFLPPYSMHDLVKVVRFGLEKAGVQVPQSPSSLRRVEGQSEEIHPIIWCQSDSHQTKACGG